MPFGKGGPRKGAPRRHNVWDAVIMSRQVETKIHLKRWACAQPWNSRVAFVALLCCVATILFVNREPTQERFPRGVEALLKAPFFLREVENFSTTFDFAVRCLHDEGRDLKSTDTYVYPDDADAHFDEIHESFRQFDERPHKAAGYSGPWIENVWINTFGKKLAANRRAGKPLSATFGPFVPLLVPWTDLWVNANPERLIYPSSFKNVLKAALRPSVIYVTVSQCDLGIYGNPPSSGGSDFETSEMNNILVLSAGGYGHVAIPLLAGPLDRCEQRNNRSYDVSFQGTIGHAPKLLRERMAEVLHNLSTRGEVSSWIGQSDNWKAVLCDSFLSMCPRGYGRSSYRLAESIQLGRVPVVIFSDVPWTPYPHLYEKIGYVAKISEFEEFSQKLLQTSSAEILHREVLLANISKSHFTFAGVMNQISLFLLDGHSRSDLRCRPLPTSIRDE